jgi:twitching motility protein PilT
MDALNSFLRFLVEYQAEELNLAPNQIPYILWQGEKKPLSSVPLSGIQVNTMIFPIIPPAERQKLTSQSEVEFPLNNPNGSFIIKLRKGTDGFAVSARSTSANAPKTAANPTENKPTNEAATAQTSPAAPRLAGLNGGQNGVATVAPNTAVNTTTNDGATPQAVGNHYAESLKIPTSAYETPVETSTQATEVRQKISENGSVKSRMDNLFRLMSEAKASDLHLSVSLPPMIRKDGKILPLDETMPTLTPDAMRELLTSIMPEKNKEEFENRHDTDFAYEIKDLARFRANIFMDRKGMGGVFRIIPSKILTAEQLNLSKAILDLCYLSKGLVVVTGPTGSGKSTTLCAMMDYINRNRDEHVITIEDPIEFVHENKQCLINQREVHNHTDSFKNALRAALREDPDILLVGEMRDLETISIAIETAETGHLVFGTLHTTTAASTVDRIIDQFPADRQQQIRVMLSESLKGVIAQTLLPKKGGGRIAALEILIITPAISNLIREGKTFQIPSAMQVGKQQGMVMLNEALIEHVKSGVVEPKDAYVKAVDKPGFEALLTRNGLKL